ncbi:MAG: hypothetical protein H5T43_00940 [Methanomethylovorans sp.]|nr:hypothetical protein [Methanomethylovorans sp.]
MKIRDTYQNFIKNQVAASSLPLRFVVSSILMIVIILMLATATSGFLHQMKMSSLESEISRMDATASLLYNSGPGSNLTIDVNIPKGCTVILGALPGHENSWPHDAKNYFLEYEGKYTIRESKASYSNEFMDGVAVIGAGKHKLYLTTGVSTSEGILFVRVFE